MKTIKLSETKGIMRVIAKAKIDVDGEYFCMMNGQKVRVIKG